MRENDRERDVDMTEVVKSCEGKTKAELDMEWEEFKKQFKDEHAK